MPERLADQNSGPRVGGHQRWVFPLCIEHKRKWGFWGQAPLCRQAFLDQLSTWEPGPASEGPEELGKRGGQDWGSLGMGTV